MGTLCKLTSGIVFGIIWTRHIQYECINFDCKISLVLVINLHQFLQCHGVSWQLRNKAREITRHLVHRPIVNRHSLLLQLFTSFSKPIDNPCKSINNQLGFLHSTNVSSPIQPIRRTKCRKMLNNVTTEILDSDCILQLYVWINIAFFRIICYTNCSNASYLLGSVLCLYLVLCEGNC